MMEEGATQEKYGDERVLYAWCDSTRNKEPKKKKGTLWKIGSRGGGFGWGACRGDNTPTKNFLKKIVYKANTAVSKIF